MTAFCELATVFKKLDSLGRLLLVAECHNLNRINRIFGHLLLGCLCPFYYCHDRTKHRLIIFL